MRVNLQTQLIEYLTEAEAQELQIEIEALVLRGIISERLREIFEVWRIELGYDDRQGLLLMSTAFPQRVLISLLRRHFVDL